MVFITENDVLKKGQAGYPIERIILTTGEIFNDGSHILYVNGSYRDDSDLGKLMHDFSCWDAGDMNFDLLKEATRYYKENPKGVDIMCKAFEETRKEGELKGKLVTLNSLINKGRITPKEAAEEAGMSLDKFLKKTELLQAT